MKSILRLLIFICCLLPLIGCFSHRASGNAKFIEAVMTEGMSILVYSKHGNLLIEAGKGAERCFTWDGESFKTTLNPRKKRWYGALGLYHPQLRPPHKNVVHMTVEEHQTHYQSVKDAIKYMNSYEDSEDIYRDDGLFVRFRKETSEKGEIFISILVVQIMINGVKPSELPGSQNNRIVIQ